MKKATKRILVVEDDREIRFALCELLNIEGYSVESAQDGKKALEFLQAGNSVDLILLDLMMPVMGGAQFRETQLRDPSISEIPVVVLSADTNIVRVCKDLKIKQVLKKPVNLEDLLITIEQGLFT